LKKENKSEKKVIKEKREAGENREKI